MESVIGLLLSSSSVEISKFISSNIPLVVVIVILLLFYIEGSNRGFISQVISLTTIIISALISKVFGKVLEAYFRKYFTSAVLTINETISKLLKDLLHSTFKNDFLAGIIGKTCDSFASFLGNALSNVLPYIIVFLLSLILLGFVSNLLIGINRFPIIGRYNQRLGGAVGVIKAVILIQIFVFLVGKLSFIPQINDLKNYLANQQIIHLINKIDFFDILPDDMLNLSEMLPDYVKNASIFKIITDVFGKIKGN